MFFLPRWSIGPKRGFTLIEVLIVIAIIGVLAAFTFLAVRPDEYLERARDSERKGAVKEIWTAQESYFVFNGRYVGVNWSSDSFENTLGPGGTKDLKVVPRPPNCVAPNSWKGGNAPCGYASDFGAGPNYAVLYARLESRAEKKAAKAALEKAGNPNSVHCETKRTYWAYSLNNKKFGYICKDTNANPLLEVPVQTDSAFI